MRRRPPNPRVAGFTLIEALAALSIAAILLLALYALQYQLIHGQQRTDQIIRTSNLEHDALALVKDVNPSTVDSGDIPMPPNLTLHWASEPISDEKLTAGFPRGDGNYEATLYRVTVQVQDAAGHDAIAPFTVERVGWAAGNTVAGGGAAGAAAGGR